MRGLIPFWAVACILLAAALMANAPFVNNRVFVLGPRLRPKRLVWRLAELAVYALAVGLLGRWLEGLLGQVAAQRWEFYAIWVLVFLTLAFPGFVWRYLRRGATQ